MWGGIMITWLVFLCTLAPASSRSDLSMAPFSCDGSGSSTCTLPQQHAEYAIQRQRCESNENACEAADALAPLLFSKAASVLPRRLRARHAHHQCLVSLNSTHVPGGCLLIPLEARIGHIYWVLIHVRSCDTSVCDRDEGVQMRGVDLRNMGSERGKKPNDGFSCHEHRLCLEYAGPKPSCFSFCSLFENEEGILMDFDSSIEREVCISFDGMGDGKKSRCYSRASGMLHMDEKLLPASIPGAFPEEDTLQSGPLPFLLEQKEEAGWKKRCKAARGSSGQRAERRLLREHWTRQLLHLERVRYGNGPASVNTGWIPSFERNLSAATVKANAATQLKIYMYHLPTHLQPKIDVRSIFMHGPWEHKYADEAIFQGSLECSPHYEPDPLKADLFFVPMFATWRAHHGLRRFGVPAVQRLFRRVVAHIATTQPWFNRSLGADHVFFAGGDVGSCIVPDWRTGLVSDGGGMDSRTDLIMANVISNSIFLQHSIAVDAESQVFLSRIAAKDWSGVSQEGLLDSGRLCGVPHGRSIVVPPFTGSHSALALLSRRFNVTAKLGCYEMRLPHSAQEAALHGTSGHGQASFGARQSESIAPENSKILLFFAGALHTGKQGAARRQLIEYFGRNGSIAKLHPKGLYDVGPRLEGQPWQFFRKLAAATFCACPPGLGGLTAWSPRLYQAVLMGCIPVVIYQERHRAQSTFMGQNRSNKLPFLPPRLNLPFGALLPPAETWSVSISATKLDKLHTTLMGIRDNKVKLKAMRKVLCGIRAALVWRQPWFQGLLEEETESDAQDDKVGPRHDHGFATSTSASAFVLTMQALASRSPRVARLMWLQSSTFKT